MRNNNYLDFPALVLVSLLSAAPDITFSFILAGSWGIYVLLTHSSFIYNCIFLWQIGEEERKDQRVVWDGHTASMEKVTQKARENISIEEQIATIHKTKGLV